MKHFERLTQFDYLITAILLGIFIALERGAMTYQLASFLNKTAGVTIMIIVGFLFVLFVNPIIAVIGIVMLMLTYQKARDTLGPNYVSEEDKWSPFESCTPDAKNTLEVKTIQEQIGDTFKPIFYTSSARVPPCIRKQVASA